VRLRISYRTEGAGPEEQSRPKVFVAVGAGEVGFQSERNAFLRDLPNPALPMRMSSETRSSSDDPVSGGPEPSSAVQERTRSRKKTGRATRGRSKGGYEEECGSGPPDEEAGIRRRGEEVAMAGKGIRDDEIFCRRRAWRDWTSLLTNGTRMIPRIDGERDPGGRKRLLRTGGQKKSVRRCYWKADRLGKRQMRRPRRGEWPEHQRENRQSMRRVAKMSVESFVPADALSVCLQQTMKATRTFLLVPSRKAEQ